MSDIKERSKLTKEEWKEYTKTVWSIANVSHPKHPAVFPDEIPKRLIKLFSFVDETVLDPFGGTGTTAAVALQLDRRAICIEQNQEYVRVAQDRCASYSLICDNKPPVTIYQGDSTNMENIDSHSISLIVTSPPYWDKANYGDSSSNIGKGQSYFEFLQDMKKVYLECMRVLQPGRKLCIVTANVNQHTEHGLLTFPLASDFACILREIGMVMINEIIWSKDKTGGRWGSANSQRPIFGSYPYPPNFLFKNVHEYILIFAKPSSVERKGPKVRKYADVMGDMI